MKYLKFFETTIKHTDPLAVNNPLKDFSRKLEDIIIEITKIDNYKDSTVRRYFNDDGKIHINYINHYSKIMKILLQTINDDVLMDIYCYKNKYKINTSLDFCNFAKYNLEEYITIDSNDTRGNIIKQLQFHFPLSEINKILDSLDYYSASKKYNL
jgi:hypothetical protein